MGKLVMFNMVTLDGFFAGPNGELDWHNTDDEFQKFAIEQIELNPVEVIVFGRKTYEMMKSFWTSEHAKESDPIVSEYMNTKQKIVFSKTLESADWNNTKLIKNNAAEEMLKLKQHGKDMIIFGSANLSSTFIKNNLIDEYRLMVNPILLGKGIPLFQNIEHMHKLKFVGSRVFDNGNVLLSYSRN